MKLKEILNAFDQFAPFPLQEDYDNSGIQFGNPDQEVNKALICLDVTEEILEEAKEKNCDLIISHHPLIFKGIKKLTGRHYTERVLIEAVRANIAIVSVHTNLDSVKQGVNLRLATKLGLENLEILQPRTGLLKKLVVFCPFDYAEKVRTAIFQAGAGQIGEYDSCSYNLEGKGSFRAGDNANPFVGEKGEVHFEPEVRIETVLPDYLEVKVINAMLQAHPYEEVAYDIYSLENYFNEVGAGMLGELNISLDETVFLDLLKSELAIPAIRHSAFTGRKIKKVALCGGSGSFLKDRAMALGADVYITADIKYHDFFDVQKYMLMVDVGHYESEQFTKEILYEIVRKKFTNFALLISDRNTNPVYYY